MSGAGVMQVADRYAADTRTLLDLTAYELRRLNLPAGTRLALHAAHPELMDDLANRLDDYRIERGDASTATVQIHLWTLEEAPAAPRTFLPVAEHLLVVFRNRLSHRSVVSPGYPGLWFPSAEWAVRQRYRLSASWGVLGPEQAAWLSAATLANRARRHDLGYNWADRGLLTPTERSWRRYLCPQGLLVGSRR